MLLNKMNDVQISSPKKRHEDFLERVSKQLDSMKVSEAIKKTILTLLLVEINYPTIDEKNALVRYGQIINSNFGSDNK